MSIVNFCINCAVHFKRYLSTLKSTIRTPFQLGNTISRQSGTENADGEGATAASGGVGDVLERELHEGPCRQNGDEGPNIQRNQQWATNYKEAAIFLEVRQTNFTLHS